jgi:aryl-alcohol dehydrogenase-like predicted oxidoreductase
MTLLRRPLGSTGLEVSILGFGGAPIGFSARRDPAAFVPLLRHALDLGINFFDTAPDYRESEELMGRAFQGRRSEVVLATKCGRVQSWNDSGWDMREDWSRQGVVRTLERSLRQLRTDYLDLVQLHSPPGWVLEDGAALEGLLQARREGKARHIGISADGEEARRAVENGVFATLQASYSILQQEPGRDLLPAAAARGMGVIVKQPLANGIPEMPERPEHPDWAWKWDVARQMDWKSYCAEETRLGLALRWVLANPLVSTAIVGTTDAAHLEANVAAAAAPPLDAALVRRIEEAYFAARRSSE